MKVMLADDESLARERLRALLEEMEAVEVVWEACNGVEALETAVRLKPDVILLDINMPGMDGIRCARELSRWQEGPSVIFVTAHDDFALQAFEVAACDYLLKPVRRERLTSALKRAERFTAHRWKSLSGQLPDEQGQGDYICARRQGEIRVIPLGDVHYFLADQKYVTVRLGDGEALIEDSLKTLEQEYGDRFVRIHRNALVALNWIDRLEKGAWGGGKLWLRGFPEALEVSRRCYPSLRAKLLALGKSQ